MESLSNDDLTSYHHEYMSGGVKVTVTVDGNAPILDEYVADTKYELTNPSGSMHGDPGGDREMVAKYRFKPDIEIKRLIGKKLAKNIAKHGLDNGISYSHCRDWELLGIELSPGEREIIVYSDLSHWKKVFLSDAVDIWKKNPRFIFVPSRKLAGKPETIKKVLIGKGVPVADIMTDIASSYNKDTPRNVSDPMHAQYIKELEQVRSEFPYLNR